MKCLKCNKNMSAKRADVSVDSKNNKKYKRSVYWCKQDDIWITVEIPKLASKTTLVRSKK